MPALTVKERIAYVRGLIEGADAFSRDEKGRTIWENLLLICDALADTVQELEASQEEMETYLEAVDQDLTELEEGVVDGPETLVEVECPQCGEGVCFEEGFLYDENVEVSCPECGTQLLVGEGSDAELDEAAQASDSVPATLNGDTP